MGRRCWSGRWTLWTRGHFRAACRRSQLVSMGTRSSPLPSFIFLMKGLSFFSYRMAPSVCLCRSVVHVCSRRTICGQTVSVRV